MTERERGEIAELPRADEAPRDGIGEEDHAIPLWFNVGFYGLIGVGIVYIVWYAGISGWSQRAQYEAELAAAEQRRAAVAAARPTENPFRGSVTAVAEGKQVFDTICLACHLADGTGLVGPSLVDPYWKYGNSDPELFQSVSDGRPLGMPPWARSSAPTRSGRCSPTWRRCRGAPSRASARRSSRRRAPPPLPPAEADAVLQARAVEGRWRRLRWWADAALIAVLLGIPWLEIGGEPLVWLDIPARKFHGFGLVIVPQELYFLWLLLAGLALALFLFSALLGRLWCGWACPQTVFTDVFAAAARFVQSRARRRA